MKKTLIALSSLFALSALAAEQPRLPVATSFCGSTDGVVSWQYTDSGNVLNGVRDTTAYVQIIFASSKLADGSTRQTLVRLPVEGLFWDTDFRNVIYQSADSAPVLCASKKWYGQQKFEKNCELVGYLAPERGDNCEERSATNYAGEIVIKK
jgi:hypothetical protein